MEPLNPHPLASTYPDMAPEEYATLQADVAANGVRVPVVLYEGKILDGRHRYKAAVDAGVECPTTVFEGTEAEAALYAHSLNFHRRHLTTGQRAAIAVALKEALLAPSAKMHSEGDHRYGDATVEAAAQANVSRRTIFKAEAIKKKSPKTFERMARGEMSLSEAEKVVEPPKPKPGPEPVPDGDPPLVLSGEGYALLKSLCKRKGLDRVAMVEYTMRQYEAALDKTYGKGKPVPSVGPGEPVTSKTQKPPTEAEVWGAKGPVSKLAPRRF